MPDVNTGKILKPAPFQVFILSMLFGWRTRKGDHVRFNKALISMARTNSKTALASYICVYELLFGEPKYNKQIVIVAKAMKQASISFRYSQTILNKLRAKSSFLKKKIDVLSTEIRDSNNNWIKAYASEASTLDGIHASVAVVDELHEMKDRSVINSLQSGMIQNPDAQLISISTAGFHTNYPMYEDYTLFSEMLEKDNPALDRILFLCWEQDDEKEISYPETWIKSNPLMCMPQKKEILTERIEQDRDIALKQGTINSVFVKNMNIWRSKEESGSYLNIDEWNDTLETDFDVTGRSVYIGVDLSKSNDSTALAFVFPFKNEGNLCWYIDSHSFIATRGGIEAREKTDEIPYRKLEEQGQCSISQLSSGIIDIDYVYEWLVNFINDHQLNVISVCYDSWNFNSFLAKVDKHQDWAMIAVRQGTYSLNTPTREFREKLINKQIVHSDNKILQSNFMNAIVKEDNNGIKLDKSHNNNKIDAADAVMDAFSRAIYYFDSDNEDDNGLPNWTNEQWNNFFNNEYSF
ncbi:terminase large subunit [Sporolactobacillus sp. CQH2019]|uniref:terminase large subunit n=1 Tax=Sporolactobacillus sp. CQH2019 TaxID=3023512 RepID=UPI002368EF60|nr:terminase TerL endonuclease subunit [Sporolactobacillus sp. CQH2019]MDD9149327.1 terminase large subunit [Sporolactobacillus sp. CQH2019]